SDWNTGTNWTTNTVPTAADIPQFNASTTTTIDIRQANTQVGGLQWSSRVHVQHYGKRWRGLLPNRIRQRGCRYFRQCSHFRGERRSRRDRHAAVHEFEYGW